MSQRGDHDGDGETVGQRNAQETEAARAMQILIRADRARPEENQRKRSEELRDQFLRCSVHSKISVHGKGICARLERLHSIWNAARSASLPHDCFSRQPEFDQLC